MCLQRYCFTRSGRNPTGRCLALVTVTLTTALAAGSGLVSLAFGLSTLDRWARRRRPHELAWTVAMSLFFVASMSLWWAEARGWSRASFRVFFGFGAVINVPWLGLGTVYLLAGKRAGDAVMRSLLVFTGFAIGVVFTAPVRGSVDGSTLPTGKEHFGVLPRVLAAVGSSVPALVIFAGAAWSAWRVLRGSTPAVTASATRSVFSPARLAAGNILIAAGALVLSASGTFAGRLGASTAFAVTLAAGIAVLFVGFLVASNATTAPRPQRNE